MKDKMYVSKNKKCKIVFDDYVDERAEFGSWWVGICNECFLRYKEYLKDKIDNCGSGCCSIKGCNNEADYYADFKAEELIDCN